MKIPTRLGVVVACIASSLGLSSTSQAWSGKEHIQLTRLAAMRIIDDAAAPQDLKDWLRANTPLLPSMEAEREYFMTAAIGADPDPAKVKGLCWWAVVPDNEAQDRNARDNGLFGFHERFMHYIDLEFFNPEGPKRTYQLDLSSLPKASDVPHDPKAEVFARAGFLPLAREYAYQKFVASVRAGRLAPDPTKPEDKDNALRWAGYLAHYTEDNTQPQHATMDYKSAQYFKGMRNSPNVHAEVEYRMIDDPAQPLPELRAAFWPLFTGELASIEDPTKTGDVFASTIDVAIESYHALPLIGEAAKQALKTGGDAAKPEIDTDKFFRYVGDWNGKQASVMQMKAHQLAWAVLRTQRVLVQAWNEAKQPPKPGSTSLLDATSKPSSELLAPAH